MAEARKKTKVFDPNLFIPDGVDAYEVQYPDEDYIGDEEVFDAGISDDEETVEEDDGNLDTPDEVTIVSMRPRISRTGQIVVDIVIEVGEVDDDVDYDVHVSKA